VAEASIVSDDEFVIRHVPEGEPWQTPHISSANFELRHDRGETGVSVTRWRLTSPGQLLARLASAPDARVTQGSKTIAAQVAKVRGLGFEVVAKARDDDPGHAEIQSGRNVDLDRRADRRKLKALFEIVPPDQYGALRPPPAEPSP
jgi:hypothetical protein